MTEHPCHCYACTKASETANPGPLMFGQPVAFMRMFLCPTCGNKRCPGAVDHRNACSGSNEPGQPGSFYEATARGHSSPRQVERADSRDTKKSIPKSAGKESAP